jgi:hypothetical protein
MKRKFFLVAVVTAPLALSACGGAPSGDALNNYRDGAKVKGTAGANWTEAEIRSNAFGVVCSGDGEKVTDLVVEKDSEGTIKFSATCVK